MLQPSLTAITIVFLSFVYFAVTSHRITRKLPPSIKPIPLLGNVLDLPPKGVAEFRHWLRHKDVCGPISSLKLLHIVVILLHDREAVQEILARQSAKSADRPTSQFASVFRGFGKLYFQQKFTEQVRRQKKLVHQQLGSRNALAKFDQLRNSEGRRFLHSLLETPELLFSLLRFKSAKVVLSITYGYFPEGGLEDRLIELNEETLQNITSANVIGRWPVDIIPQLRFIPDGWPGSGFKKTAHQFNRQLQATVETPFEFVQKQMAAGNYTPSFVSELIKQKEAQNRKTNISEDDIKWTAAMMYLGAVDTTTLTLKGFFLAMTLFPQVQTQAQAEIDALCRDRIPSSVDRDNLPYINALVTEIYRWWPLVPMGFPHTLTDTIEYNGYTLPKGAIVMANVWWLTHDPVFHADPDRFDPSRFLEPRIEPDPRGVTFGFGRRTCSGQNFADEELFLAVAQTLSVFNIDSGTDLSESDVKAILEPKPGIVNHVPDFPCRVTVRGPKHEALIRQVTQME